MEVPVTHVEHVAVWHVVFFVFGMALHVFARYLDWRGTNRKKKATDFFFVLLRKKFVTAKVMSLLVLVFWSTDYPISGVTMSSFVPHTNLIALVLGYASDSVTKYITNRIPFLQWNKEGG